DRADAVALGVDAPPAEVRPEPLGRDRVPALAGEALDLGVGLPRIQLALEPLDTLRLRFLHGFAHRSLQNVKGRKTGAILSPSPGRYPSASSSPGRGLRHPRHRRGTPTRGLHRTYLDPERPGLRGVIPLLGWENTHCRSRLSRESSWPVIDGHYPAPRS